MVTRTSVLTEPGNTTLEAVATASSEDADLFKSDLAATEPSSAAFTTKDGDQHTLPRVCESSALSMPPARSGLEAQPRRPGERALA